MKQETTKTSPSAATPAGAMPPPATTLPTIALRKSCNPDGIGLSHYVLMDRKAAK